MTLSASILCAAKYRIETVAGSDFVGDGGPASAALLGAAEGLAADAAGNVYIADAHDCRVRKVDRAGVISTLAGDGRPGWRGDGGPASAARLRSPYGLAVDSRGWLYLADLGNARLRTISPQGDIFTVIADLQMAAPRNLVLDRAGNLYVSDFGAHRVYKVTPLGAMSPVAGSGVEGFSGDGGPAESARLAYPAGLALGPEGELYIADSNNDRIRKVHHGVISTVLVLRTPTGMASDLAGNLYFCDRRGIWKFNSKGLSLLAALAARDLAVDAEGNLYASGGAFVYRVTPFGAVSTLAGRGGYGFYGDGGPATGARLFRPSGVALDGEGNILIADTGNRRTRMVDRSGIIRTVDRKVSVSPAMDSDGTRYVPDPVNHRVIKIAPGGRSETIAGTGFAGFSGDGGPALAAELNQPVAVALDAAGNLYVADSLNDRIRKLTPVAPLQTGQVRNAASLLPGPVAPGELVLVLGAATRAAFDGRDAPILQSGEAGFIVQVPPAVAGQSSTRLELYEGAFPREAAELAVVEAAPAIFTVAGGTGQAAVVNQDGSLNSPARPAPRNSVVTLFATGEGLPGRETSLSLSVGGQPAAIVFAGPAPGYAGLFQINARIPGGFLPSGVLPLELAVGAAHSQPGVTLAVE